MFGKIIENDPKTSLGFTYLIIGEPPVYQVLQYKDAYGKALPFVYDNRQQ
jgi:hypothetical protein